MSEEGNGHILESQLRAYCAGGIYPMHMPGHKRSLAPVPGLPYDWDVTEVPGTDDLHHPDGILKEAMERTSRLWGSRRTWYLVNSSTCGILASIYACVPAGGEIIAARNCHKSVYHAIELLNLRAHWILPAYLADWEIFGSVSPAEVKRMLRGHPAAKTVIITSPTYEGILSDIEAIAAVCHAAGARLIVDEAHGAHLGLFPEDRQETPGFAEDGGNAPDSAADGERCSGFAECGECGSGFAEDGKAEAGAAAAPGKGSEAGKTSSARKGGGDALFPDSALHLGADLVIQSVHKTLPSLTQTALLHLGRGALGEKEGEGSIGLEQRIGHALDLFETSSPSYPLMASIDGCTGILAARGGQLFDAWRLQILKTRETIAGLHCLKAGNRAEDFEVPVPETDTAEGDAGQGSRACRAFDAGKLLLRVPDGIDLTGEALSSFLREHCGIQAEMHCGRNVLLMSGCGDSEEGWDRLRAALVRADQFLEGQINRAAQEKACETGGIEAGNPPVLPERVLEPAEAGRLVMEGRTRRLPLSRAAGAVCAEYVMAYPPGIPILVPGERITAQSIDAVEELLRQGANVVSSPGSSSGARTMQAVTVLAGSYCR